MSSQRAPCETGEIAFFGAYSSRENQRLLADSASFFDGVLFVLLLVAVTALAWTMLSAKVREPLNIFTAVLAFATAIWLSSPFFSGAIGSTGAHHGNNRRNDTRWGARICFPEATR